MREWLFLASEWVVLMADALALAVIAGGTLQAFGAGVGVFLAPRPGPLRRDVWLRYTRWLIAGLTFQLAADIVETAITSEWETIGRVAAIAAIRTVLNFFLERDLERFEQQEPQPPKL